MCTRRIALLIAGMMVAFSCRAQQPRATLNVCRLISNPEAWEGQIVRIRGLATITQTGPSFYSLVPSSFETCGYSNSQYRSSSERAEILLTYPDFYFRANSPPNFRYDAVSVADAQTQLRAMVLKSPSLRRVLVTVDGFVSLRKYRLPDTQTQGPLPVHTSPPVTLIVESYSSVESASGP